MPILDVQVVGALSSSIERELAPRLADAAAKALASRPRGTWVKVQRIAREDYAEAADGPEEGVLPVFVYVLKRERPEDQAWKDEAAELTRAVASACERPAENVHVIYAPSAAGRITFGGQPVE